MQLRPSEDTAFYSCAAAPPLPKRGILIHLAYPCATEEARGTHGRPVLQAMGRYGWSVVSSLYCVQTSIYIRVHHRVSFHAKLHIISRHGTERLYTAEATNFCGQLMELQDSLLAVKGAADVLRLAVCKLYPARYGLQDTCAAGGVMTATSQSLT